MLTRFIKDLKPSESSRTSINPLYQPSPVCPYCYMTCCQCQPYAASSSSPNVAVFSTSHSVRTPYGTSTITYQTSKYYTPVIVVGIIASSSYQPTSYSSYPYYETYNSDPDINTYPYPMSISDGSSSLSSSPPPYSSTPWNQLVEVDSSDSTNCDANEIKPGQKSEAAFDYTDDLNIEAVEDVEVVEDRDYVEQKYKKRKSNRFYNIKIDFSKLTFINYYFI